MNKNLLKICTFLLKHLSVHTLVQPDSEEFILYVITQNCLSGFLLQKENQLPPYLNLLTTTEAASV